MVSQAASPLLPQESIIPVEYGRVMYVKLLEKNKSRQEWGNRRLKLVPFRERGKTSRHISLDNQYICGVKVDFCQDVKTEERDEGNYLYLTVEFRSRTKRHTVQYFYVLLAVHLSMFILEFNQLDAQRFNN